MRLTLVQGDITEQQVDAVVNAANSSLMGGGGVDGAIHRRGGPAILEECRELRASRYGRGLPTGQAAATTAGRLPARWVIHTVGPVHSAEQDRAALLASCYRESLKVADSLGAASVAFPAVSAGIYGWPLDDAARIAVCAVTAAHTDVEDVRFVLFGPDAYAAFEQAAAGAGPTDDEIMAVLAAQAGDHWRAAFETGDVGVLHELGAAVDLDWPLWRRITTVDVAEAHVSDAVRLAASIAGDARSGGPAADPDALRAVLDRLRRWYENEW